MFTVLTIENFLFFNTKWYSIEVYLAFTFFFVYKDLFVFLQVAKERHNALDNTVLLKSVLSWHSDEAALASALVTVGQPVY